MFPAVPLPIIRCSSLYIKHWYMSCRFDDSFQAGPGWSCLIAIIGLARHIQVPNLQWKTPDDGQRNCPKHVGFLDKNKFGKFVRLLVLLKRKRSVRFCVRILPEDCTPPPKHVGVILIRECLFMICILVQFIKCMCWSV
jgi:hypothetical protein